MAPHVLFDVAEQISMQRELQSQARILGRVGREWLPERYALVLDADGLEIRWPSSLMQIS